MQPHQNVFFYWKFKRNQVRVKASLCRPKQSLKIKSDQSKNMYRSYFHLSEMTNLET